MKIGKACQQPRPNLEPPSTTHHLAEPTTNLPSPYPSRRASPAHPLIAPPVDALELEDVDAVLVVHGPAEALGIPVGACGAALGVAEKLALLVVGAAEDVGRALAVDTDDFELLDRSVRCLCGAR